MNEDEFIEQIQDVQRRVAELRRDAKDLPLPQKSRLTESLERLTNALRDLQVAEEAIRLLLSAVQQSRDSIVITTALLDHPGPEIVYVNPAFTEMTGYGTEEVLGKTPRLLQGANTDKKLLNDLRWHLREGQPFHGEAINYHKDGTEFFVEWNITPIRNVNQTITHYVAIQRNITERKVSEQEREKSLSQEQKNRNAAETANRAKDEFLATLSHELRTPLTPILGWSKVLQMKQLPEAKVKEALAQIEENARRQAQLVDDLLDVSRITQGKLTLSLSSVPLVAPINAALETVRLAAQAKSIHIETILDTSIPVVIGDIGRLQQIMWNILSNAIKFTPENGNIMVKLERVDHHAQITVSDTGRGINPKFIRYIFDRFRQEDNSITREFGGLGLGLSLSRQLVEAHGGRITASSPGVGQGAVFTITLPLMIEAVHNNSLDTTTTNQAQEQFNLKNTRVLVVEDEPAALEFISFIIEEEGAVVTPAASAKAALAALKKSQFDILVCDIGLQETDGYTLIRRIRALSEKQNRNIKAIALTAYASEANKEQAINAGFQLHIAKPFEPSDLIAAIAQLFKM
ncbi:hybrid sensor histidine kinase/response regulator [Dulcicalothrix desertica PCC 7102]|uniref:histidine kinase n=1 Tax=Dulcicalothrix desertica PCC 7102 TaxID=232991 RepID=A0A3S1D1E3_9CYAN|nr:ATP-binding protein [Dulcicalothrix desertica]RUT01838.1 hybrid sensor histidine kinase/response regulator [Dulcicalothrix desertica PCC 7102]TWH42991.1 PAS domain S-box-containing protein [Dulcicalothrix desertica PCC 7102]